MGKTNQFNSYLSTCNHFLLLLKILPFIIALFQLPIYLHRDIIIDCYTINNNIFKIVCCDNSKVKKIDSQSWIKSVHV